MLLIDLQYNIDIILIIVSLFCYDRGYLELVLSPNDEFWGHWYAIILLLLTPKGLHSGYQRLGHEEMVHQVRAGAILVGTAIC
jgi:hypothetical protein